MYGTTPCGGSNGIGVVFKITPSGMLKVLYNFDYVHGEVPYGGLTLGTGGNFYGTTIGGGAGFGTIFKITRSGSLTTLYSFTGGTDGNNPVAPPIQGADENFYGTSSGTAYKISPSGTFAVLGSIGAGSGPLLQGADENFYGTTLYSGRSGLGTVFKITPKGIVTIVYNFDGTHGQSPECLLTQSGNGNLYGTAAGGGSNNGGVVFKLTPLGAITVLHNFDPNDPLDGNTPPVGLVQATDGNFYGVASNGGTAGYGVIFKITSTGTYSILHNFDSTNGALPFSTPMQHTNGKIYGLTFSGGTSGDGVVYSLDLGLGPFVRLVSISGNVGKTVEILGQGFTGTTSVSFNGAPATFKVVSATYLTATVPSGATTGFVTVVTPSGTLTSNKKFQVKIIADGLAEVANNSQSNPKVGADKLTSSAFSDESQLSKLTNLSQKYKVALQKSIKTQSEMF